MKFFKIINVVFFFAFTSVTFAQLSNVEGLKPLEGVTRPKAQSSKGIKPGTTFKDCNKCPEMVVIPAGSFLMGSAEGDPIGYDNERPQHRVQIRSFAIGKHEVTQEEWEAIMGTKPSFFKGRKLPVDSISWNEAQEFVQRLSKKTGKNYRLPSEAEWEYAARGGSTTVYPWGNDESEMPNYAWFQKNSNVFPHKVGLKTPNQFGLHDMLGNVSEWVEDCWNEYYFGVPKDGSAWTTGDCSMHVVRGGSWVIYMYHNLRANYRDENAAEEIDRIDIGFRVARTN